MKLVYTKQTDLRDCGVSCLMSIVRYYGGYVRREYVREITNTSKDGVSAYSLLNASSKLGMEAKAVKGKINDVSPYLPVIAHIILENGIGHFVVISKINKKEITVMDPSCGFRKYSHDEWKKLSTNTYLIYKPKNNLIKQIKEQSFLKVLFNILKDLKKTLIIIFLFSLIYALANVFISYEFKLFMQINQNKIINLSIFIFLILILKETSNLFRNLLVNYLNHHLDKTLMHDVYSHIIKLPYSYFKSRQKGDMITRLQDVSKIRDVISKFIITLFIDCLFVVITLIVMFHINKNLTFIILIITIIYITLILIYSHFLSKKMQIIKEKEVVVNNHLIESLSSIDTIKGMQIEEYLSQKLSLKHNELLKNSFSFYKLFYNETFIKELLYGISCLIVILFGTIYTNTGIMNITSLMVYYTLMIYYFSPITNICNMELLIKDAHISFIRIKELLNIDEEKQINNKIKVLHLNGNINIYNLIYSYNGIDNILECKKIEIKNKDKVLLYGISGGGKSTLMKIIAGYILNYKGDIFIDNINFLDYDLSYIREKITYLSQEEVLYTDTIYNNIVLDKNISFEKYKEICDIVDLKSIYKRSILRDEMVIENNACNLSGGEKQRILLARSLVKNSDIYIFDESFSALDLENERKILIKLFNYLKDKTVIVISHRMNNRDLYQKFISVKKGKVYEY